MLKRGIDSKAVIEEINNLNKYKNDQSIEILADVTIKSGTYIINDEGILEMQSKYVDPTTLATEKDNNTSENNTFLKPVYRPSPNPEANNDFSFQPFDSSSPKLSSLLEMSQTFQKNVDFPSPCLLITSIKINFSSPLGVHQIQ